MSNLNLTLLCLVVAFVWGFAIYALIKLHWG